MSPCPEVPLLSLLLLGLGLTQATTPGTDGATTLPPVLAGSSPSSPPVLWTFTYRDIAAAAVELLNSKAVAPYVLRLWDDKPQPSRALDLRQQQELSFTAQETTCRAPGKATAACRSRWLGSVTRCQGWVFLEQQQPTVELSCEKVPIPYTRLGRHQIKAILGKIKERIKSFFQCGKIWIRDRLNLKGAIP